MYNSQLTEKRTSDAWREVFCFLVQELRNFFRAIEKKKRKISSIKAAKCSLSYFAAFIICSTTKKKKGKRKMIMLELDIFTS